MSNLFINHRNRALRICQIKRSAVITIYDDEPDPTQYLSLKLGPTDIDSLILALLEIRGKKGVELCQKYLQETK